MESFFDCCCAFHHCGGRLSLPLWNPTLLGRKMDGITRNPPAVPPASGVCCDPIGNSLIFLYLILDVLGSLHHRFPTHSMYSFFRCSRVEQVRGGCGSAFGSREQLSGSSWRTFEQTCRVELRCCRRTTHHGLLRFGYTRLLSAFVSFDPRSRSLG